MIRSWATGRDGRGEEGDRPDSFLEKYGMTGKPTAAAHDAGTSKSRKTSEPG